MIQVIYLRNYKRCFRRVPPHTVMVATIGVQYMPFTHSVERWYA